MIDLLLLTLILLNNATYPGGYINVSVQGNGTLMLLDNCTYFCGYNTSVINVSDGNYSICVSYSCRPGIYTLIADNKTYNFTVLEPSYSYLLKSILKLERENKNLRLAVEKLNTTLNKLEKENKELTVHLKECTNVTDELMEKINVLMKENSNLRMAILNLENKISEYEYMKIALIFVFAFIVGAYVALIRR